MVMRLNREISEEFEHIKPKINLLTTEFVKSSVSIQATLLRNPSQAENKVT